MLIYEKKKRNYVLTNRNANSEAEVGSSTSYVTIAI